MTTKGHQQAKCVSIDQDLEDKRPRPQYSFCCFCVLKHKHRQHQLCEPVLLCVFRCCRTFALYHRCTCIACKLDVVGMEPNSNAQQMSLLLYVTLVNANISQN